MRYWIRKRFQFIVGSFQLCGAVLNALFQFSIQLPDLFLCLFLVFGHIQQYQTGVFCFGKQASQFDNTLEQKRKASILFNSIPIVKRSLASRTPNLICKLIKPLNFIFTIYNAHFGNATIITYELITVINWHPKNI